MSYKVGRLTILDEWKQDSRWYVLAVCDCGVKKAMRKDYIQKGKREGLEVSCGCRQKEQVQSTGFKNKKYEYNRCKLQSAYKNMLDRCYNPEAPGYSHYGGRGIIVCGSWLQDKEQFIKDVGIPEQDNFQLDRINTDGNYEPGNVRWVSAKNNVRNRTNTLKLTIDEVTKPLAEWSEISGVNYAAIKRRVYKGWKHKEAVFTPANIGSNIKNKENYL